MKQFVFTSIEDATRWLDVSATHKKIKDSRGIAALTREGTHLHDAEVYATDLMQFIENLDLKKEIELQFEEGGGVIDFSPAADEAPMIDGDYFAQVDVVKRLYASWKARRPKYIALSNRFVRKLSDPDASCDENVAIFDDVHQAREWCIDGGEIFEWRYSVIVGENDKTKRV